MTSTKQEMDPVDEAFNEWIRGEGGKVVIERFRDSLKLAFISGMKALSDIHQAIRERDDAPHSDN